MKRRVCVLLTCLALLMTLFVMTAAAEETGGSFVLTVSTANSMVIEPERIPYTSGQTIKEALLASGHTFTQLEEQNYIGAVDDVAGNYVILYDNGGYEVSAPASSITAMRIGVTSANKENQEDMLNLVRRMAEYRYMENHVQNYPDAQEAYKLCLNALRGNGANAAANQKKLDDAIAAYEAILNGAKYAVTVSATQNGTGLSKPVFSLTDIYGNVTSTVGTSLQVVAGDYTFCVSDGTYNRTEGNIRVREGMNFSAELPTGEWFDEIYIRQYDAYTSFSDPYKSTIDKENHKMRVWIDDTAKNHYGANIVCYQGPDIPDAQTTMLHSIYISTQGEDMSDKHITWSSKANNKVYGNFLTRLVDEGLEGRTFQMEAQYVDAQGHTEIQSFEIEVLRAPTLKMLAVYADGARLRIGAESYSIGLDGTITGALPVDKYFKQQWTYTATTTANKLEITAEGFSPDYVIEGLGPLTIGSEDFSHTITVTAPGKAESTYTLQVKKVAGVYVTLALPEGTTGQVFTDMDSEILPQEDGRYCLSPGQEYYYVGTKNTYFHTKGTFTAADGLKVNVAEPVAEDWLSDFQVYSGRRTAQSEDGTWKKQWVAYDSDKSFSPSVHEYTYYPTSSEEKVYLQATTTEGTAIAYTLGQSYVRPYQMTLTITNPVSSVGNCDEILAFLEPSGYGVPMRIQIEKTGDDGVTYYQDYSVQFTRRLELYDMTVTSGSMDVTFETEGGQKTAFDRDIRDYRLTVDRDAESVTFSGQFVPEDGYVLDWYQGGFYVLINDVRYEEVLKCEDSGAFQYPYFADVTIPLTAKQDEEQVKIEVHHLDPTSVPATYTLTVHKSDPVPVEVKAVPSDLLVFMTSDLTGNREYDKDGIFMLTPGRTYTYNATHVGYVGQTGTLTVPESGGTLEITLEQAPENSTIVNLPVQWPHLRTDNSNNGVIDSPTPISSDDAVLYWATKIGEGFDQNACSPPIMVNGDLYVYSGSTIYRVNKTTGEIMATGTMCGTSNFGINPPTYADGMIFVGLSMGRVQAFNASTLESLWVYTDPLGGQPNCPIVYHDGYVYTGFWSGEDRVNNYVCLTATDEDPSNTLESKIARWTYSSRGGFYWSGAYVCDQFTLIGTDDGEVGYTTGYAHLLSLDTSTGKTISDVQMNVKGDIRSSITQYEGKYYFTSKGGYFFEASVDSSGTIQQIREKKLSNGANNDSTPAMSTSTPTIYNGRAYVGVSGTGQFTAYSGHNITVIDIANWEIAYSVPTQGYPQTSGVLTTAYEQETGKVYVYFFDNFTPGKLRVLEDSQGQVSTELTSEEYGIATALNLFEPRGDQAQYAICSPVVDSDGTIYFKNDSAYLMAVGSTIEELEVTKLPDKTEYTAGEKFDGTGMEVVAHFKNGVTKDVTEYVTWSEEPLTETDADFQILYPIVMYQNADGDEGEYEKPSATVTLTIHPAEEQIKYGDVNGDGTINMLDCAVAFQRYAKRRNLDEEALKAADVNGDGKVDMLDCAIIFQYYAKQRFNFPVG